MKIEQLHGLVHAAETGTDKPGSIDVALVGRDGTTLNVFRIEEVYVDYEHGLLNIVFDQSKKV